MRILSSGIEGAEFRCFVGANQCGLRTRNPSPPIPIKAGTIAVDEDGFDVVLTLVLRLGTNEALDMCLRVIGAVSRIKQMPGG